jgi:hypothetical protein
MPGPDNLYLIAEYTKSGILTAYYKGYLNYKFHRFTLYPHQRIGTFADKFDKKHISEFDVKTKIS